MTAIKIPTLAELFDFTPAQLLEFLNQSQHHWVNQRLGLHLGQTVTLAAGGGTGKTWLALELLQTIATGSPRITDPDNVPQKPLRTLLIDTERGPHGTATRFAQLALGRPAARQQNWNTSFASQHIGYHNGRHFLDTKEGFAEFERLTDGYDVVVIDSLSKMFADIYSDASGAEMQTVRSLSQRRNCLFFFLHHTSQAVMRGQFDRAVATHGKGNQSFTDNVDLLLTAREHSPRGLPPAKPGNTIKYVLVTKGKANDVDVAPLLYAIEGSWCGPLRVKEVELTAQANQDVEHQAEILKEIGNNPGSLTRSAVAAALGRNKNSCLADIRDLIAEGHVIENDEGKLVLSPHAA